MKFAKSCSIIFSLVFATFVFLISLAKVPIDSVALADATASAPTSQPATMVKIDNFAYLPKEVDIAVGATVTWQNADDVPHTATSKDDPQTFDSGALDTDEKFSFTFTKPGKYPYYCKVHPHMTGVVIVK